MRLEWQCPICYAQIGDKSYARMITCPFCGTLLIVDSEKMKFYPVKKEKGWYYFPKVYLRGYDGYLKLDDMELFFKYSDGKWILHIDDGNYEMRDMDLNCDHAEMNVEHVWGDLPLIATPEQRISLGRCPDGVVLRTSKGKYAFVKI